MRKHQIQMLTPAADWRDAIPCGDGSLSALVYGGISPETILFNHDRLWYMGSVKDLPNLPGALDKVREMGQNGDLDTANSYITDLLKSQGIGDQVPIYHPAFSLKIQCPQQGIFDNYRRKLDYESGEATVSWAEDGVHWERQFFISRVRHIGVFRIRIDAPRASSIGIQLCEPDLVNSIDMSGTPKDPPLKFYNKSISPIMSPSEKSNSSNGCLRLEAQGSDGGTYGAILRVLPGKGNPTFKQVVTWSDQVTSLPILWGYKLPKRNTIFVENSCEIMGFIGVYINSDDPDKDAARVIEELSNLEMDYDALLEEHVLVHSELFNRVTLELHDDNKNDYEQCNENLLMAAYDERPTPALYNRLFDMGRYLLMCSSNENSLPPTLQGNFNGDYFPPWNSFYVHNENTQMFYWQALPGRMSELMGAFFSYFENFIDDYRINAKRLFGCRGIMIPLVGAANTGLLQDPQPHVLYFTGCAAWIASHFYDYWLFSRDRDFLVSHVIPFLEEVALFYEDYLQIDDDGKYFVFPSNSPENAPKNSIDIKADLDTVMNPGIPLTYDSTIDIALVKETLHHLCDAYEYVGVKHKEQYKYKKIITRLKSYRVNSDGALAEWVDPRHHDNYNHRHLSHIYPFFPGNEITKADCPELVDAIRRAVDLRLKQGWSAQTGWSLTHIANIYARLGDSLKALYCLDSYVKTCVGNNLFSYHNDYRRMGSTLHLILGRGAPFQIDAAMGLTSAIQEMLAYSTVDKVWIAPAVPNKWKIGKISGLATRCSCDISISWNFDEGWMDVVFNSKLDQQIAVYLPHEYSATEDSALNLKLTKGQKQILHAEKNT